MAIETLAEVQKYKKLEKELQEVYGGCDGLLETAVDGLCKHPGVDIGSPKKSRLLTDEDADKWDAYRKLGTVEELTDLMVVISEDLDKCGEDGIDLEFIKNLIELKHYRDIGTLEACRKAVEKQKPKKPVLRNDNGKLRKSCLVCGCFFSPLSRSCPKCGQAILQENKDD